MIVKILVLLENYFIITVLCLIKLNCKKWKLNEFIEVFDPTVIGV